MTAIVSDNILGTKHFYTEGRCLNGFLGLSLNDKTVSFE